MKRRIFVTSATLVVAFVVGGAMANAQTLNSERRVNAKIDFEFLAGSKPMPAGEYGFEVSPAGPVIVTGPDGGRVVLAVITQLGRHDQDPEAEFVFDKIGGKFLLSEVWFPGKDGLCVLTTPGPHTHTVVGGPNARK